MADPMQQAHSLPCRLCKGVGEVEELVNRTGDPQDSTVEPVTCPRCGGDGSAIPRALGDLIHFTQHCLSAADEGVDYAVSREWLEAMTTIGLMKKCGRGKWAPTEQAVALAGLDLTGLAALRAAPEGFVLVPVVPTAAMEIVLVDWLENNESSSGCYAAMLAARPQGVR